MMDIKFTYMLKITMFYELWKEWGVFCMLINKVWNIYYEIIII